MPSFLARVAPKDEKAKLRKRAKANRRNPPSEEELLNAEREIDGRQKAFLDLLSAYEAKTGSDKPFDPHAGR